MFSKLFSRKKKPNFRLLNPLPLLDNGSSSISESPPVSKPTARSAKITKVQKYKGQPFTDVFDPDATQLILMYLGLGDLKKIIKSPTLSMANELAFKVPALQALIPTYKDRIENLAEIVNTQFSQTEMTTTVSEETERAYQERYAQLCEQFRPSFYEELTKYTGGPISDLLYHCVLHFCHNNSNKEVPLLNDIIDDSNKINLVKLLLEQGIILNEDILTRIIQNGTKTTIIGVSLLEPSIRDFCNKNKSAATQLLNRIIYDLNQIPVVQLLIDLGVPCSVFTLMYAVAVGWPIGVVRQMMDKYPENCRSSSGLGHRHHPLTVNLVSLAALHPDSAVLPLILKGCKRNDYDNVNPKKHYLFTHIESLIKAYNEETEIRVSSSWEDKEFIFSYPACKVAIEKLLAHYEKIDLKILVPYLINMAAKETTPEGWLRIYNAYINKPCFDQCIGKGQCSIDPDDPGRYLTLQECQPRYVEQKIEFILYLQKKICDYFINNITVFSSFLDNIAAYHASCRMAVNSELFSEKYDGELRFVEDDPQYRKQLRERFVQIESEMKRVKGEDLGRNRDRDIGRDTVQSTFKI